MREGEARARYALIRLLRLDWFRLVLVGSGWFWLVQVGFDWFRLVQIDPTPAFGFSGLDWFRLV